MFVPGLLFSQCSGLVPDVPEWFWNIWNQNGSSSSPVICSLACPLSCPVLSSGPSIVRSLLARRPSPAAVGEGLPRCSRFCGAATLLREGSEWQRPLGSIKQTVASENFPCVKRGPQLHVVLLTQNLGLHAFRYPELPRRRLTVIHIDRDMYNVCVYT